MGKKKDAIVNGVINQIEKDLNDEDYESLDEMLNSLVNNKKTRKILMDYLSDETIELIHEGKL